MASKLLNLIQNNLTAKKQFQIRNAESDTPELFLYDAIGDWYGISAESFVKALKDLEGKHVNLRINSPGGDVFEARAIATAIANHRGGVTAYIDGLAASAATYVALAAQEVVIAPGSFFMIHNAWTLAMGNAKDLTDTADLLRKIDQSIAADYQRKTGLESQQITDWMDAETWFNADETLEHGFADRLGESAQKTGNHWNLSAYNNTPSALCNTGPTHYDRALAERRLSLLERVSA